MFKKLGVIVVALFSVSGAGYGIAAAASSSDTGTNVACATATATTPDHTVGVDGTDVHTIAGTSTEASHCETQTYTIPTNTVTSTATVTDTVTQTPTQTQSTSSSSSSSTTSTSSTNSSTTTSTTSSSPPPGNLPACDVTESSVAAVNADVASKPAGTVICLAGGTYGALALTNSGPSASTPTIVEGTPGASTTVAGASLGHSGTLAPSNLVVQNFHVSAQFTVGHSAQNDTISYDDIYSTSGCTDGQLGIYPQNNGAVKNLYITHNKIHDSNPGNLDFSTGCQADAVDLYGQFSNILFAYNDLYRNSGNPAAGDTHTDVFQICSHCGGGPDAPAGVAADIKCPNGQTVNVCIYGNYVHDNKDTQGLPFWVGHDNGTFNSTAVIDDNLTVRNDDALSSGIQFFASGGAFEIKNNTLWSTSNSMTSDITPNDSTAPTGTGSLDLGQNLFDQVQQWNGSTHTIYQFPTEHNYCNEYRSAPFGWNASTGACNVSGQSGGDQTVAAPAFKCAPNCGDGTPAGDDYELASNPNDIGIDWNPANQQYGPN